MLLAKSKDTVESCFYTRFEMSIEQKLAAIQANIEKRTRNVNVEHDGSRCVTANTVTKSNALARAYYRFSLVEKRCMESLISKLNPLRMDNNIQHIRLSATEYSKAFGVSEKVAYRDIKSAVSGLMGKVLSIPTGDREDYTLMAKAKYLEGLGRVECCFNPLIVVHLIGMRNQFTSYPLSNAADFSSSYTWRFYELLISWARPKEETGGVLCGWLTIEIAELRRMLGIPASYRWDNIQKQVLNVAVRELDEKVSIKVVFEAKKTIRTYTHIKIEFIQDDQQKLVLEGGKAKKKTK